MGQHDPESDPIFSSLSVGRDKGLGREDSCDTAESSQGQVSIGAPTPEVLQLDASTEVFRIGPAQRQTVPQARKATAGSTGTRDGVESIDVTVAQLSSLVVAKCSKTVVPDLRDIGGIDPATAVANPDGQAVRYFSSLRIDCMIIIHELSDSRRSLTVGSRKRDFDRLHLMSPFDRGTERVLQQLRDDVLQVGWDMRQKSIDLSVDHHRWTDAIPHLAHFGHKLLAVSDDFDRTEPRIDDPIVARRRSFGLVIGLVGMGNR